MNFTQYQLQQMFGHEAAEDEDPERLNQYYFRSKIYDEITDRSALKILVGHKGVGKSALFQVAMLEDEKKKELNILIKPDDIIGIGDNDTDFLSLIRSWKLGINKIIAEKSLSFFDHFEENIEEKIKSNSGKVILFISGMLNSEWIANKINTTPIKKAYLENFKRKNEITIYIDDLDRGWQGKPEDIRKISALLNAIRDISTESRGIKFKVSLRADVYYLVRTSDESTDKIEGSVVWFTWTNHEILTLLVKRIDSFFGKDADDRVLAEKHQSDLMKHLTPIIDEKFTGKGHWNNAPMYRVLMSLIRKRPRDLVKLLTLSGKNAIYLGDEKITTRNLENVFEEYSQGRLQDTINEYRSELPQISRLILGMKPTRKERINHKGFTYTNDELIKKIKTIMEQGKFYDANKNLMTEKSLAAFLYKVNFITARKETPSGIDRKYFEENRYLSNEAVEFGYDWEVHPAYRWALQPDDINSIFESLKLSE